MIIGISGKINSGKDTIGKIIQILTQEPHFNNEAVIKFLKRGLIHPKFENKKFADKLKDIVCLLIGCTREQLEDREFKEKELGEEWWHYRLHDGLNYRLYSYLENKNQYTKDPLIKMNPRLLLQLLGTDIGRNIIHPNIWVNSLFADYKAKEIYKVPRYYDEINKKGLAGYEGIWEYPNWIITDIRFPNELKAVKDRNSIIIRVNRNNNLCVCVDDSSIDCLVNCNKKPQHESETTLDNAEFDYVIYNNSNLNELIDDVKYILTKEKLL